MKVENLKLGLLSTGVDKSFVVAAFGMAQESHETIMYMYKSVNA